MCPVWGMLIVSVFSVMSSYGLSTIMIFSICLIDQGTLQIVQVQNGDEDTFFFQTSSTERFQGSYKYNEKVHLASSFPLPNIPTWSCWSGYWGCPLGLDIAEVYWHEPGSPAPRDGHQQGFTITEKAPTRVFSGLKAGTNPFIFQNLLRHYAKWH